jgi:hypothetical protein
LKIFVSYRRDDVPDATDRLTDALGDRFGRENVFVDIDTIELGADVADLIADWVARADVFLAVIGRNWADAKRPDGQRRIDDPGDYTRIEIEAALRLDRRAVPVLIDGAMAPAPSQLPPSIAPLMRRNAFELSRRYWDEDLRGLIAALEKIPERKDRGSPSAFGTGEQNLAGEPEATDVHREGPGTSPGAVPTTELAGEAAPSTPATASPTTRRGDEITPTIDPVVAPRPGVASELRTASESLPAAHGPPTPDVPHTSTPAPATGDRPRPDGIFICYRREDTRWPALSLADALRTSFPGRVFMDVDRARLGDWHDRVKEAIAASAIVVVLIGESWLEELNTRLTAQDEVRYEIAEALRLGKLVVPVTLGARTSVPDRTQLPGDIAALVDGEAILLLEDRGWKPTVQALIEAIAVEFDVSDTADAGAT